LLIDASGRGDAKIVTKFINLWLHQSLTQDLMLHTQAWSRC
jgi:hypothetical protein